MRNEDCIARINWGNNTWKEEGLGLVQLHFVQLTSTPSGLRQVFGVR